MTVNGFGLASLRLGRASVRSIRSVTQAVIIPLLPANFPCGGFSSIRALLVAVFLILSGAVCFATGTHPLPTALNASLESDSASHHAPYAKYSNEQPAGQGERTCCTNRPASRQTAPPDALAQKICSSEDCDCGCSDEGDAETPTTDQLSPAPSETRPPAPAETWVAAGLEVFLRDLLALGESSLPAAESLRFRRPPGTSFRILLCTFQI